ncbi:MAG TPA: YkvA family protein [Thermoanaerobaculia bacterium]|nr:YkvA family protein [Thermoanaerobaculia bacterium]
MDNDRTPEPTGTRPVTDDLSAAVAEDLETFNSGFDPDRAEEDAVAALGTTSPEGPSSGLLSFYDRLREKIIHAVEKRGGKLGEGGARALLLVPDVFMLLMRLSLDRDVPKSARALIGGTLAYFVLPVDLFPEALLGGIGFMDDLVLATAVLAQAFSGELEPYARRHWSGSDDLRVVLRDITQTAQSLLGQNLYDKVKGLLRRKGIEVEEDVHREVPR